MTKLLDFLAIVILTGSMVLCPIVVIVLSIVGLFKAVTEGHIAMIIILSILAVIYTAVCIRAVVIWRDVKDEN